MTLLAPVELWVVRHAAPLVAPGICYGALDVSADPAATQAAAQRLARAVPATARVVHSPRQRCTDLAHALRALLPDLPIQSDDRLVELDFGTWEGQAWDTIGRNAIDAWTTDFAHHAPGGGESLTSMLIRVQAALEDAQPAAGGAAHPVVWITHAGVARCVQWLLSANAATLPRADQWPVAAPAWGDWSVHEVP